MLLDNDVVVTTATKVQKFLKSPSDLTIRIGDFDPTSDWTNSLEDFPHVEMEVVCIKLHPREICGTYVFAITFNGQLDFLKENH